MNEAVTPGRALAIGAEALYVANLMIAPGLAFLVLALLWWRCRALSPPLARAHLDQTFWVSLVGGMLIGAIAAVLLVSGLPHSPGARGWLLTGIVLYFTCIHSTLIVLGVLGLARAMAGQPWRYPLIGPRLRT